MARPQRVHTKDVGLSIGLAFGRYFLGTEDLHFGYWPDDLSRSPQNLPKAQDLFSDFLAGHIPKGARRILDVGCGSGKLARRLIKEGYSVDGVSPSEFLSAAARENLAGAGRLYECRFEDLETTERYDVVMFSESFQYMKLDVAVPKLAPLLNDGGHVLICDFFRTGAPGKSLLGGGHRIAQFEAAMAATPFDKVLDIDITPQTAPNIDLLGDMLLKVGVPVRDEIGRFFRSNFPLAASLIKWKYGHKLANIDDALSGSMNGTHFATHKTYRLFLFQKRRS